MKPREIKRFDESEVINNSVEVVRSFDSVEIELKSLRNKVIELEARIKVLETP